jgi:uncharacterized membrane protein YkvA (DUF1232 family)
MKDLGRMLRAMVSRRYRVIPWLSIGAAVFSLVYVIDPIDLIPDYLPFVGVIDDALVLGLLWRALRRDVKKFLLWEEEKQRKISSPAQLHAPT